MLISVVNGATSIIVRMKILSQATAYPSGLTGLTQASAGLVIGTIADNEATTTAYTQAGGTIQTIPTLGTYAAPSASNCRFKEVDATNHPGVYELQFANARYAVSNSKYLLISIAGAVTNLIQSDAIITLPVFDPYSSTNSVGGITGTTLPAVVPSLAQMQAGLPTDGSIQTDAANAIAATTPLNPAGVTTLLARVPGTVQPQTGDSYGRLGAPAGASVSADILTANTGIILAQGLVGTNIGVRNTSYDGSGNLLGADLCLYDTAAHALTNDGATGLLHKFTIAATFAGTQMTQQSTRQIS